MIKFMLITNDPGLASKAEAWGVARIFVDLEQIGKQERQGHLDTLISAHEIDDIAKVKSVLHGAELLVRVNPLHDGSEREVDAAIESGADLLMLPMFSRAEELERFSEIVGGRIPIVPLVETHGAVREIEQLVKVPGLCEIYIGLNDLHLDLGLQFMFQPLASGMVDELTATVREANLPFGFGGIARVGEGVIPGELILAEHARLGSSSVILSRTFHRGRGDHSGLEWELAFEKELRKLMDEYERLLLRSEAKINADRRRFIQLVERFVAKKNAETQL